MKVLRLHRPLDMRFSDEPAPTPGPGEVLLRVGSVGVCASDVHYYREGRIGDQVVEKPTIMGHEFSAVVEGLGPGVDILAVGDRVAVEPGKSCGTCPSCIRGYTNLCPDVVFFGTPPVDGSLRELLTWPASLCVKVGQGISLDEAAMIEPLAVGIYSVELARMDGGESVVVQGAGAIGLSVLQGARAAGAGHTIVTEPIPERRAVASHLGADLVLDPAEPGYEQRIMEEMGGGADIVFECAGMPDAVWATTSLVRPEGRIVIVGIPEEDQYCLHASLCRRREVNVQFVRRSRDATEKSIRMLERGEVNVKAFATHAFAFEQAEEAFRLAMEKTGGVIRAVIRVSEERPTAG